MMVDRFKTLFSEEKDVIPFSDEQVASEGQGFFHKTQKYVHHTKLHPQESAFYSVTRREKSVFFIILILLALALVINWHETLVLLIAGLTFLYFFDLLFNLFLIYRSFSKTPEISVSPAEINQMPDSYWPTYTIFCPLYNEWEVLPQFVTAMSRLDYPKEKLQVMLLLEENDPETIQKAQEMNLPSYFEIVVVPHSFPKTKPKACNYGLTKATGEYTVIYDAEDAPDPL